MGDLRETLGYATPEERKECVKAHIREIRVPEKGPALLEINPAGLLSSLGVCELLVTRGESILKHNFFYESRGLTAGRLR